MISPSNPRIPASATRVRRNSTRAPDDPARAGLGEFFDRTGTVRRPPIWRLGSEIASLLFYHPRSPKPTEKPAGASHSVLVIPAFLTSDSATRSLRAFLERCGYRPFGWGQGLNIGPTRQNMEKLRERLLQLRVQQGGPISVVGVSLGGLLARSLAHDFPEHVLRVVTLASPLRLPTASNIEFLLRLCARWRPPALDTLHLASPLAVPSTAIYTCDDGIVAWETCRSDEPNCTLVQVRGPHLTICRRPEVRRELAHALATRGPMQAGS